MKKQQQTPETFNIDTEYVNKFIQALHNTEIQTHITNSSITIDQNGIVTIMETKSSFLINLGMQYQKLLK